MVSSDPGTAAIKALALLKLWHFPNNYTLGKRLTELMVRDAGGMVRADFTVR